MEGSSIRNFYQDQTVFVTGGSGFLGKILIEKLLYTCDVKKIYILMRPKKGKSTKERSDNFFNFPCFDRIKTSNVDLKSKICFIDGDCEVENLGINQEWREVLIHETTIVIHAAANVKFDQSLREAANINVRGTRDVLELAKSISLLKAFVYVSTAYSNCPNKYIREEFYKPPMTSEQLFKVLNAISDETLEETTPLLLGKWPNTYAFTKSIAEDLIKEANLPIAMVRPSIVISTAEEPIPGWIDNFYGIVGIALAGALGVLRSFHAKADNPASLVPCDYVVNNILAAAWRASQKTGIIYNFVGSDNNTLSWKNTLTLMHQCGWDYPSDKLVWYCTFKIRENRLWHKINIFILHTMLAYFVDFILLCVGRTPLAVKNYARLDKLMGYTTYFGVNQWKFDKNNVKDLWCKMNNQDRKLFKFDMDYLDWSSYLKDCIIGARIYLLKDPLETLPKGQRKLRIITVAHYTLLSLCYLLVFFLIGKIIMYIL